MYQIPSHILKKKTQTESYDLDLDRDSYSIVEFRELINRGLDKVPVEYREKARISGVVKRGWESCDDSVVISFGWVVEESDEAYAKRINEHRAYFEKLERLKKLDRDERERKEYERLKAKFETNDS